MKYNIKDIGTATILSFGLMILINYIIHLAFPQIPIIKVGVGIIILLVSITLIMLFVFVKDGSFTKEEMYAMMFIIAIMVGVFWVTKHFLPELYSFLNNSVGGTFSIIP